MANRRHPLLGLKYPVEPQVDREPEWAPNNLLDFHIARARKNMGEERWRELNEEWEATR